MRRTTRRLVSAVVSLLAVLAVVVAALVITGHNTIVVTRGVSMSPTYHQGDLVVVARKSTYRVGEIAAYPLPDKHLVVLHRIVGGDARGFVFKGDNNSSIDPTTTAQSQLRGRAVLHIPQGGTWLRRLTTPPALGTYAFLLLAGSGTAHRRRKRRRQAMERNAQRSGVAASMATLPPSLRAAAAATAGVGVLAIALGAFAWTGPAHEAASTEHVSARQMTFSYSTPVAQTAAYDGTTASSPDPIFRKLAKTVDVHYSYRGAPGTIAVTAVLSTDSGWHSTVPLRPVVTTAGSRYAGTVHLDLSALEARAAAAATVTGIPRSAVLITVSPTVTPTKGAVFAPRLGLDLTPLRLSLAGDSHFVVSDATTVRATGEVARSLC